MGTPQMMRILRVLCDNGKITLQQAQEAADEAHAKRVSVFEVLVGKDLIKPIDIVEAIVTDSAPGTEIIEDGYSVTPDRDALIRLPESNGRKYRALPLSYDEPTGTLTVLVPADKLTDATYADDLKLATNVRRLKYKTATHQNIDIALERAYRADAEMSKITTEAQSRQQRRDEEVKPLEDNIQVEPESQVVRFVNLMLSQAINDGASDIHIEPQEGGYLRIRFRIDGVLVEKNVAPPSMTDEIISHVKVKSLLDIAIRQRPQDGRLSINHPKRGKMDLRINVMPTVHGEKIVMRILDNSSASLSLRQLGFSEANLERFSSAYRKPYGMVLVTGPTGSGKSTTLYATLNEVTTPQVNVVTVEDPVEYRIPGITQVQVEPKQQMTFAAALRSILRADPDIILVGEIRDHETAQIAIESGMTGHLVLSTLHTNDASSAVTRLAEMGIEPFLVGSVLEAVLAQRLIRKLCPHCKEPYEPSVEMLENLGIEWDQDQGLPTLYRAVGCTKCSGTGYRGRMAVHEVLLVDEHIEKMAVAGKTSEEILQYAVKETGMRTMKQDGWDRVLAHQTSVEEILRVII